MMKTIKQLREEHRITQLDLAYKVGVTPATIHNWESNRHKPRVDQLRELAAAFGTTMDAIDLSGEEPPATTR